MPDTLPDGDMLHEQIEAQNLAERYIMGKLSSDESDRFEEHFVDLSAMPGLAGGRRAAPGRLAIRVPRTGSRASGRGRRFLVGGEGGRDRRGLSQRDLSSRPVFPRFWPFGWHAWDRTWNRARIASLDWRHRYEAALRRSPHSGSESAGGGSHFLPLHCPGRRPMPVRGPESMCHATPVGSYLPSTGSSSPDIRACVRA